MTPNEYALWDKYQMAKSWFDKAIDERNDALVQLGQWKEIAEWRYRRSTTYVVGFCMFVLGMFFGTLVLRLK